MQRRRATFRRAPKRRALIVGGMLLADPAYTVPPPGASGPSARWPGCARPSPASPTARPTPAAARSSRRCSPSWTRRAARAAAPPRADAAADVAAPRAPTPPHAAPADAAAPPHAAARSPTPSAPRRAPVCPRRGARRRDSASRAPTSPRPSPRCASSPRPTTPAPTRPAPTPRSRACSRCSRPASPRSSAQRVALLVQACEATAALVRGALMRPLDEVLRDTPPVPATRRLGPTAGRRGRPRRRIRSAPARARVPARRTPARSSTGVVEGAR